jgi:16S rRNA processing protein RimM
MKQDGWVEIGRISGVHGIRGWVRVHSFCENDDVFRSVPGLRITPIQGHESIHGIQEVKRLGRSLGLALKGITDRNQAKELIGSTISCQKEYLPRPEDGSYYWFDLIGMQVFSVEGEWIGMVDSIIPTAGNDVFVVRRDGSEILVPAVEAVVREVNSAENRILVSLPEGLRETAPFEKPVPG